ncbi:MAG: hypothetical protein ACM3H8_13260, partial [Sphingobacteriales bacterium]
AEEKKIFHHQPALLFDEPFIAPVKEEEKKEEIKVSEVKEGASSGSAPLDLAPQLVEVKQETPVIQFMPVIEETPVEPIVEVKEFEPIHFELKPADDSINKKPTEEPVINKETKIIEEPSVKVVSGGYLARPANIYTEETTEDDKSNAQNPVEAQQFQLHIVNLEEEAPVDMQLVVKNNPQAAEEPVAHQTIQLSSSEEPPVITDEAEEQRKKAAERLQKLRNLSFNINAADPNNEFDNVPAYLRRNMELYNTINTVENFYSSYTVKTDENNKTEISTVNTFLDGKKPD